MPEIYFGEAARRHWDDAELLSSNRRFANADHLYGLAAECALKGAMVALGAPADLEGDLLERQHRQHIDVLWSEYQAFAQGRRGARYVSLLAGFRVNPFTDWRIHQRYAPDSACPSSAALTHHTKASRACLATLERVRRDAA